jgi:CzcA family heavy metal efflux pump
LPNPPDRPPEMLQPLSSTNRVLMVRLNSQELSPIEMSVLARWTIRPRLLAVPGVANVSIWGQRERQLQVRVDPETLHEHGVTLQQVIETTGNALWVSPLTFVEASTPGSGGFIDTPQQRLGIYHRSPIRTADDLAQVILEGDRGQIPATDGQPLRLGDVAQVVEDHQLLIGDAVAEEGPAGLILMIEKLPEANTLEVTRGVEQALAELQPGLPGIQIDPTIFRPASYIELSLHNLNRSLLLSLLLVALVLAFFLFEWRSALISIVAIPLSLMAAALVLAVRDATVNTMVLAGFIIAIGVVVDDAIIDIENIVRRLREQRRAGSTKSTQAIILDASLEIRDRLIFGTVAILIMLVPIFYLAFLGGLTGAFFRPLALSYVLAVLASMLVAMTVTPALALLLLRGAPVEKREPPVVRWLQRGYGWVLERIIHRSLWASAAVAATVLIGLLALPLLRQGESMLPEFQERDLLVYWEGPPGTSHPEMVRITSRVSQELRAIPGVRSVITHVGRAVGSDQAVDVHAGELWVSIDPNADYEATRAAIEGVVSGYPGLYHEVLTYLGEKLREVRPPSDDLITVRIYGEDFEVLRAKAEEVAQRFASIDGVSEARVVDQVEIPQVEVQVDLAAAQRHGLKPGDVRRAAATLASGLVVGHLFEEQKVFEVVVWATPEKRQSVTDIEHLLIDTPSGDQVRLGDVASVRITPTPTMIRHDTALRYMDVTASISGRSIDAVARDVEEQLGRVSFPLEYHATVLGEFAERQAAQRTLLSFALAAVVLIFLLLQASFGSWRLAALIFLTLPSALVGGVLAVLLSDRTISLGSLVGFLTVLGIAGRNGIMLLSHYQHLERAEGEAFGPGLVLRGAKERLSPILMTAFATALALVPFMIVGNIPGHEIVVPMGVVILGGLVTSTLLNLFVVPALYLRFAPRPQPETSGAQLAPSPIISPASD